MSRRKASTPSPAAPKALLGDIRVLIGAAHQRAASAVNAELTLLFWRIGQRIHTEVLAGQRAEYGEEILPSLAEQLVRDYGRSFADKNLRRMVQFAATYPQEPIVVTLSRHLSWSHFVALLPLKDPLQRDYYAQMASTEHRAPSAGACGRYASASGQCCTNAQRCLRSQRKPSRRSWRHCAMRSA
ncbi:DUF1016 N-terminal domain-containing protein [Pseudomonas aeruginosa]